MADNVPVTPTTSYTVAADDIGGVHHQRVKVGFGEDGAYGDVNATNQLPISGTVQVSGAVQVSGTVTANGTVTVANGASVTIQQGASVSAVVSGTVTVNGTVTGLLAQTTTTQAAVTGVVVWLAPTQTVTVANGASVTIQQGASVSAVVSGTVTVINPVVSTIVTILGTQVVTVVPGLSVSAVVSGTVTVGGTVTGLLAQTTTTQAAVTGLVVWLAPTQTLNVAVGGSTAVATTTQAAVTGAVVWMAPTQSVALLSTIVTILGTQIVTVAGGTTVVSGTVTAVNADLLFTVGLPTQASTAQIVVAKPAPMQYVQIAVTSTAIAQSANKYVFTIWTGATGAPAAAGTTSWAVPAGKVLRLTALQAAITSSAVLGGTVQLFVGVGATASMISASIPTQLQVLKLQLLGGAAIDRAQLFGHQADIQAGESIAVFIVASTAAVLRDFVIGGNLF